MAFKPKTKHVLLINTGSISMRTMKKIFLVTFLLHINNSYSQEYFNPLFLGSDVDSIDDLSYLSAGNNIPPGKYYLNLNVGERFIKNINIEFKYDQHKKTYACFTKEIIDYIPLNNQTLDMLNSLSSDDECINVEDKINDFSYDVDLSKLTLTLSIPQIYLKSIRTTLANEDDWDDGITALVSNYNINGSVSKNKNMDNYSSNFFHFNNRFNFGAWRLNSSFYYNNTKSGKKTHQEWKSNNTFITRNFNAIKSSLVLGQSTLGSILFDSTSYIGATLATANEMLPDSEKGYSPTIRGIAESRSKLTIRQNGNILYQEYVNPGPYNIDNLNAVGSSGDYEVELTSDDGVSTKYIVPYSTLPNLLRKGSYNYAISFGELDTKQSNKDKFSQGTFGFGLPLDATIYTGYQVANDYLAIGLGLGKDIGVHGAITIDSIQAKAKVQNKEYNGSSHRILYAKSFSDTGTNIQLTGYRYSTSNYYTFSEANYKNNLQDINNNTHMYSDSYRKKNSYQLNISQNLGDYGQLYTWGNINTYWDRNTKSKNIQLGWNKTFSSFNNMMLSASYNKNTYGSMNDNVFYLSITMPLSNTIDKNKVYLTNSTSYSNARYNNSTSIYGTMLDNKLNYNVYHTVSNSNSNSNDKSNLNLRYNANFADVNAGTSFSNQSNEVDYGLTGSILLHQGGVVFSREANDTAILIEAKGAQGARIERAGDNITINSNGYALIPYASAYHYNDVELSPETFGSGYDIDGKVLKVSPTRGAISKVIFDVRKGYNFLVTLKYDGKPIKFGTFIINDSENTTSIVNDDSTVYLTGVKPMSKYTVKIDKDTSCNFTINYDENADMKSVNNINLICN